jgi:Anticodon binding domain
VAAPIGVMIGEDELTSNSIRIKLLGTMEKSDGDMVQRSEMVDWIKKLLQSAQD